MKPLGFLVSSFAALALAAQPQAVTRDAMATVEHSVDTAIRGLNPNEPYDLLGFTRGVYLPGYGAVLTAEVNLVTTVLMPFQTQNSGASLARLRQKKIQRVPPMRELMRQALVDAAATLDPVPSNEQIVFALTLFYRSFEEREGLPRQIIMQAPKQALLDFKANRLSKVQLDAAIQVREL